MTTTGRSYGGLSAEQRIDARRTRLLGATNSLIAEHGIAGITVDSVCRRAELTKRYFYELFDTKDDLLDLSAQRLFVQLSVVTATALADAPLEDRIETAMGAIIDALTADPGAARLYAECPAFPRLRERQQRAIEEFSQFYVRQMLAGVAHGYASERQPELMVRMVVSGATELIVDWLQGGRDIDRATIVSTISEVSIAASTRLRTAKLPPD